ncbi:hypothetical protein BDZ45DRAFT_674804 [Acephala macrosclerotiorum]|nr:hypothetical protein BDZ45DRAFT_674804 [Acephala macrosclerotiorum]
MNAITQYIVDTSTLDVSNIKITNATKDSFYMSITSVVNKTGPVAATMSAMTVKMVGPSGAFGNLDLPEVKAKSSGTEVVITDQLIQVTDMAAFRAFVKAIMSDESLIMRLEDGETTVKSLGISSKITYNKDVHLKGMCGPKIRMVKTEVLGNGTFRNEMLTENPSALEIDMGIAKYDILNGDGDVIATQEGRTYIKQGQSTTIAEGKVVGGKMKGKPRLKGVGVFEDNWHRETLKDLNAPLELSEEFVTLVG